MTSGVTTEQYEQLRAELAEVRRDHEAIVMRICTIADEANGPHVVQSAHDAMTDIEEALRDLRMQLRRYELEAGDDIDGMLAEIDMLVPDSDDAYHDQPATLTRRRDTYVRLMYAAAGACATLVRKLAERSPK
jgi:uncharacterized coiled-coil DUF342 family protein